MLKTVTKKNRHKNFSTQPQTHDFGHVAENFVVTEIAQSARTLDQIFFWRTKQKQEVDIIIKSQDKLTPIEVKSGDIKEIPTSLRKFIVQYEPSNAYILNWSVVKDEECDGCKIHFRPIWFANAELR